MACVTKGLRNFSLEKFTVRIRYGCKIIIPICRHSIGKDDSRRMKVVYFNNDVLDSSVTSRNLTIRIKIPAIDTLMVWKVCWLYYQQRRCFFEHIHAFVRNESINPICLCDCLLYTSDAAD